MSITYHNIHSQSLDQDIDQRYENELSRLREGEAPRLGHWIAGENVLEGATADRFEPSARERVIGTLHEADADLLERAIARARSAQPAWERLGYERRCEFLEAARRLFDERKPELAALSSLETGKPRVDAIAEVEECITLIDLYISQIREQDGYVVDMVPAKGSKTTEILLRPWGVFGVIAPFNFPLAIPITMSAAALVMGNSVVLKPSALTPRCGEALAQLFLDANLPEGVLNVVQGGANTGTAMANSSVDGIAFTGSADVGLSILGQLSRPPFNRPVLAEMGGKNPVIVRDSWDDIEFAARATVRSAFGMTGQKCNACSRVVVERSIHDEFVAALVEQASKLKIADPIDPEAFAGPLVNQAAMDRFAGAVAEAKADGEVVVGGGFESQGGLFAELTIVTGLELGHPLTRRELFNPFLTVTPVEGLDRALEEANAVRYGLSAGIFSRDEDEIDRFLAEIQAGIVFVNNPAGATTGVWPGSQSMAGWKASGTAGKGGFGPWYLAGFGREQSRTVFPSDG